MSFFESDVVRAEMAEITELQEKIYGSVFNFPKMDPEEKLEHVEVLQELLEKQRIMYTRLSLSDDPDAKKMKEEILKSAQMLGMSSSVDVNMMFNQMSQMIGIMKQQLDINGVES